MSKDNAQDLIARADRCLLFGIGGYIDYNAAPLDSVPKLIRDLRDALVLSEGALIFAKRALAEANEDIEQRDDLIREMRLEAEANAKPVIPEVVFRIVDAVINDIDGILESMNHDAWGEASAWLAAHQPLEDETN